MREDETRPLTDAELDEITSRAGSPSAELQEARGVLRSALSESWEEEGLESLPLSELVRRLEKRLEASEEETRRLQFLIRRCHDSLPEIPGTEALHAELRRELSCIDRR
jgi:hypothetical protein